jgi:hypothetical protein
MTSSFVKDTYVDGKKLARNGRKTATYYSAYFPPHYRRVLTSHPLVFNLWILFLTRNWINVILITKKTRLINHPVGQNEPTAKHYQKDFGDVSQDRMRLNWSSEAWSPQERQRHRRLHTLCTILTGARTASWGKVKPRLKSILKCILISFLDGMICICLHAWKTL